MKKALSLLLCLSMLMTAVLMTGCAEEEEEDKGYMINMYLTASISTFDPADALNDDSGQKVLGLIYEGLTRIDEKGKLQKAIAKNWTYTKDEKDGSYILEIELKDTQWNDGRAVSADDFVYAWKRQLEPEFMSETASALYLIKNARAVKNGDMTIDDLCLYAPDTTLIQIEFERDVDYTLFLENCASLSMVPLREDIATKFPDWGSTPSTIATNGPFFVKNYKRGEIMELERNIYYYRDNEEDKLKKYVIPYRFTVDFTKDAAAQLAAFDAGELSFIGELPLSQRAARSADVTLSDTMSVATYVLNTTKAPFNKKEVRQALSLAVDRTALAGVVTYAKAAQGLITDGVWETVGETSFRQTGGSLLSATADMAKAKSLLSTAGVSSGKFSITVRAGNEVDLAVAGYMKGVWEQLGFTITIKELADEFYENELEYQLYNDTFSEAYRAGDFDVIAVDVNECTDAFPTLATYAVPFSGGAMDLASQNYDPVPHISGYSNAAYDALIQEAFDATDRAARAAKLHEAEKILMEDLPVIPLFTYQDAYMIKENLSGMTTVYMSQYKVFNRMKDKNYKPATTAEATEPTGETTAAS